MTLLIHIHKKHIKGYGFIGSDFTQELAPHGLDWEVYHSFADNGFEFREVFVEQKQYGTYKVNNPLIPTKEIPMGDLYIYANKSD